MDPPTSEVTSPQLPADEDVGQTSINQLGAQSQRSASQDQRQPRLETDGWELQQPGVHGLQLQFQDSNLSPALSLLPANSGEEHNFTEYSLFQQSDTEFAPLRAYPDVSMASERFHFPPQDHTTQVSECDSLSQHPLAQATMLSEEGGSSCHSPSQHSLPPADKQEKKVPLEAIATAGDRQRMLLGEDTVSRDKDPKMNPPDKPAGQAAEDETFFLSKDVPAQRLLELLQKDVGVPSSSSSAFSSVSEAAVKSTLSFTEESKSTKVCKMVADQSLVKREGPPGEASFPQQQTQWLDSISNADQPRAPSSQVCNITMGSRSTQPDDSSEVLHRELLSEVEKRSNREAEPQNKQPNSPAPPVQSLTPSLREVSEGKQSVIRTNQGGVAWTGPFSAGVERIHREHDLWSSGNQTGIDGSYLGFLPQSQSTPGIFLAPRKSSAKAKLGQLSAIESNKGNSYQSSTGICPQPAEPGDEVYRPDTATENQQDAASAKVQSLPSLNYMQKVDAWRANQSSGNTSLFDSLALQGFSGISPKKKAYDAVSESLNRILSQHVRTAQQPLVSDAANHDVTQNSSTAPSASFSPRRGEAVGSAPSDQDNTVSAAAPSASPVGRSQSHSSLSTVVMSVHKDQQTEMAPEKEKRQSPDDAPLHLSATVQPPPFISLSQFSDVSLDRDLTFSSSQDSYSGIQVGASVGASSIVSLELDNYAPYWASRLSTPPPRPRPRELNIDERIPLYLHNLGIDQSPSTILTPFVPSGPIREPEFSPTDLCTLKGSTGTPTKSTQPSEGGSPHKGDVSRSSILSVDSSMSIPFSLDSLGPTVSLPERVRRPSPPSDTDALQTERSVAPSSPSPDEDSHSSILQPSQQLDSSLTSSQNFNQLQDKCGSDISLEGKDRQGERSLESLLQSSVDQTAEDSFVSSKALLEIRRLLSHAETVISTGSSAGSSTSPSLRKKTNGLQDFSFSSSSTAGDPRTRTSMLWTRSSSDSMLTSDKLRQSSVGRENVTSSWQPDYPSTPALTTAPATVTHTPPPHSTVSSGAGTSPVLSKSARRTEPEGCSAAPPDTQPPVTKPPPAVSTQQPSSAPADAAEVQEDEEKAAPEGPVRSSSPSPVPEDTDQGVTSDGSSESSLAIRVARLLQSESPATMVSSTPSTTDHEESKAREWIKSKISGQQCEPLELDKEDRRRIEEIKRELLLKNPMKSQWSTDTESSAASSVKVQRELDPPQSAETLAALRNANNKPSQTFRGLGTNPPDSNKQLQNAPHPDLEARVCEIAAREGVILPRKNPQALTSITIATRRTSTSPSPSSSSASPLSPAPEPLHLAELSAETVIPPTTSRQLHPSLDEEDPVVVAQTTTREPPSVCEPSSSQHTQSAVANQERQGAVGGQSEEHVPGSQGLDREDKQSFRRGDELSVQNSSVSGDGLAANQATGSSSVPRPQSPTTTDHISHVHLTLSPKTINCTITTTVPSGPLKDVSGPPHKEFVPLRHSPSAASSPDEGVGLASPPEWSDTREPVRQRAPERSDTSTLFKAAVPQRRTTSLATHSFTPCHRSDISPRAFTDETPVPVLLPYKPHGSEEFFYVPQTEADVSSTERSDTTMESSHTGSDDAVPPRFSSEVLGHQDPGLDRGVTIRHTEGIYNKRLKTATFKMQGPEHTDASGAASKLSQTPEPSPQVSDAFTRAPLSSHQDVLKRDQGTSPVQFLRYDEPELSRAATMSYHRGTSHLVQTSFSGTGGEPDQQGSITLDQLWQKFCDRWDIEKSRPTSDKETSLLERLERLSRLIHGTRAPDVSRVQEEERYPEQKLGRRREDVTVRRTEREVKRGVRGEVVVGGGGGGGGGGGRRNAKPSIQLRLQESSQPAEDDSHASSSSSFSLSSSHSQHLSPADRDEAETLSTTSGSMSTVDTARLIRAFGAHRVQHLKTNSSLSKLYNTINRQKEGREQRRWRHRDPPHTITPSETEGSVVADSAASPSSYTVPSHHGPSRSLAAKKVVKLVNKSVQAGDLEIVSNGTRQHTRDVGTTFPSPREAGAFRQSSSSSSSRGRGGQRSPSKPQSVQKQRKSKRSSAKLYPEGVSWFIPADDLRSESRKENLPEEEESSPWKPSTAWFEPYSRIPPWRQPLRQRQVHEDRNRQPSAGRLSEPDQDPAAKTGSSGLARVSLQEALELRRPEFISRSRQRLKSLSLQVEERKLQEELSRERGELLLSRPGGAARLQRPAGTALLRRAVPRKEMIQRSKQIYENLPEVQRRREEERRKAEYRLYRLNAQLYNKRITNRVLGRRSAWQ